MEGPVVNAFAAASRFFVQAACLVPDAAWSSPGLGEWTLLELVGHTNRAHTTIEDYLVRPRPVEPAGSGYFSKSAIAQRGREAVAALGDDPSSAVAEASTAILQLIARTPAGASLGSPVRTMTLSDYLPSRTAELTIHGLDIAGALLTELDVPSEALQESLRFVARLSSGSGTGEVVLRALTGRGTLPDGFSVY
jgi:uncharacterized protein (TIGR03083 family)